MFPIVMMLIASGLSFATVSVGKIDCPHKFEGKVEEIATEAGASSAYSTQRVQFKNLRTLKGAVEDRVELSLLKNGLVKIEQGEDYLVQTRNGRLCWIEKI